MPDAFAQPLADHLFRSLQIHNSHQIRIDHQLIPIRLLQGRTSNDSISALRHYPLDHLSKRTQPRRAIGVIKRNPKMHLALGHLRMQFITIVKFPPQRPRQRASHSTLPSPRHSHNNYNHDTPDRRPNSPRLFPFPRGKGLGSSIHRTSAIAPRLKPNPLGDELFSLTPANFPCYFHHMTIRQDATASPEPEQTLLPTKTSFDGTNPPVVVEPSETTSNGMNRNSSAFVNRINTSLTVRKVRLTYDRQSSK
jgi:hypothetical protein